MTGLLPFDARKLARTDDPDTSKAAARACGDLRRKHHQAILNVLEQSDRPLNAHQIANRIPHMTSVQVSRRIKEMRDASLVRDSGDRQPTPTGRFATAWEAV